jgi:hypothetical protein
LHKVPAFEISLVRQNTVFLHQNDHPYMMPSARCIYHLATAISHPVPSLLIFGGNFKKEHPAT